MKKNKTIKVKVFKDRIIINLHPFIPYQNKENRLPAIKNNIKSPSPEFMP